MFIKELSQQKQEIKVAIPLTKGTEKTRIKKRSILNEYGIPVSTRSEPFTQSCYVEWQIGYDVDIKDLEKAQRTTLKEKTFLGANGKTKYLYELSEYLKYFYEWGIVSKNDLLSVKEFLSNISNNDFLDKNPELFIKRSHLIEKQFNNIDYYYAKVEYPILIHKFNKYEIITEIIIKEKQYAIGTQPMLYFCFPITELENSERILGRTAQSKETANFVINKNNIYVFVEMLKIFGTLTINHKKDILSIIKLILED